MMIVGEEKLVEIERSKLGGWQEQRQNEFNRLHNEYLEEQKRKQSSAAAATATTPQ